MTTYRIEFLNGSSVIISSYTEAITAINNSINKDGDIALKVIEYNNDVPVVSYKPKYTASLEWTKIFNPSEI